MAITTFEKAVKQYNDLMYDLCREYNTVGTPDTEGKDREHWTLRDLISEVQYTLDIYNDEGCMYWLDAHDTYSPDHEELHKQWVKDRNRMKRFIAKYLEEAMQTKCYSAHCSIFD